MRHSFATVIAFVSLATVVSAGGPQDAPGDARFKAGRRADDVPSGPAQPARMAEPGVPRAARAQLAQARSHEAGGLLWEDRYDASPFEQAFSAATLEDEIFVAGFVWKPGGRDFLLRVLDAQTGGLVWQDQVDKGGDEFASGVATDKHRVFVSGDAFAPGTGFDWLLRAYDSRTHELLWEDVFDLAGKSDFCRGTALTVGAGMVFLGGYATNEHDVGNFNTDWVVRAYDAASGALVWQDRIAGFSGAYTLTFEGGRLFAGGWSGTAQTENALVRAYDARTGTPLWTRVTPGAFGFGATWTKVVKAQGDRVFAAQSVAGNDGTFAPRVKALDASTGALRWEDVIDDEGANWLDDIDVSAGRVFAVGYGGPRCTFGSESDCDAQIRAYHAVQGTLLWHRQLDLSGLDDHAKLVKADAGVIFVSSAAGPLTALPNCCEIGQWVVSAFDDSTGKLLWQALGDEGDSGVYNMVADRGRLFIPGRAVDFAHYEWDLIVRAYDARGRKGATVFPTLRQLTATGPVGTRSYDVAFDAPVTAAAHGLIPAEEEPGSVVDDPANNIDQALASGIGVTFHTVSVAPGTRTLRVSLLNDETDGAEDLDLYVIDPAGNLVGVSAGFTSNEAVVVPAPAAGDYTVIVHGYQTDGPDANYTLFSWGLGNAAEGNLTVSGPVPVPGGSARLTVHWFGLVAGRRYLGAVSYSGSTGEIGQTLVSIHAVP